MEQGGNQRSLKHAAPMQLSHKIDSKPHERRRHQRVKVVLLGRYMLASRQEFPCQTINISPGGVALFAPVKGAIGERVVVYLDQLGRLEGTIARLLPNGFAFEAKMPMMKRDRLANQLTWLANRHDLGMKEDRRHERIIPIHNRTTLTLMDRREYHATIIDVSVSGCAIACDAVLEIGMPVTIGKTSGQVVRIFNGGIAVEFNRPMRADSFDASVMI